MTMATVVGVADKPEPDRTHVIEILLPDGRHIEARIFPDMARAIVALLQPAIVEEVAVRAQTISVPQIDVTGAGVMNPGHAAQLRVNTNQMGLLVCLATDETLMQIREKIDRVLSYRSGSAGKH